MKNLIMVLAFALLARALAVQERGNRRCLSGGESDHLFKSYVNALEGITDGGAAVNKTFAKNFTRYSQSTWWITPGGNGYLDLTNQYPASYPPFSASRYQFIVQNSGRGHSANLINTGPVLKSCDGFAFYWQADLNINKTIGRVDGIDIVFVDKSVCRIEKAYSEFNTLDLVYGLGGHVVFGP